MTNGSCHLRTWHFFQALHLLRFASCLPSLLGASLVPGLALCAEEAKIVRYSTIVLLKSYWALAALAVWVLHPEVFDPAWSKEEFTMTAVTLDHDTTNQPMTPSDASQCSYSGYSCNCCIPLDGVLSVKFTRSSKRLRAQFSTRFIKAMDSISIAKTKYISVELKAGFLIFKEFSKNKKQALEKHSKGLEQSTASNALHIDSGQNQLDIYVNLLICLLRVWYL